MTSVYAKTPFGTEPFLLGSSIEYARSFPETATPQALPGLLPPYLAANWSPTIFFRTEYFTSTEETFELAEERISFSERPRRSITVTFTGLSLRQSEKLFHYLHRKGNERLPFLIYCDQIDPQENITSGSSEITFFTYYRRLYPGQRIFLIDSSSGLSEFALIDTLFPSKAVVTTPLTNSYNRYSTKIFPVFDSDLLFDFPINIITDRNVEIEITSSEFFSSSLLPIEFPGEASFLPSFEGLPVYSPDINWGILPSIDSSKPGVVVSFENSSYSVPRSLKTRKVFNFSLSLLSRKQAWDIIRLFENRRGQTLPFWMLSPIDTFKPLSVTSSWIDVDKDTDFSILETSIFYIGLQVKNTLPTIKKLSQITDEGGFNRLHLSTPLSPVPSLSSIDKCTTAHIVKFSSDVLEEQWLSNTACSIDVALTEVIENIELNIF